MIIMRGSQPVYDFKQFRLDASEGVLLRGGRPVPLTLKAYAVLKVLVENGGHLVPKHELISQVWPDAIVEEGNLTQAISALRKALGESHQSHPGHEYIETVARRGYRFIAPVNFYNESARPGAETKILTPPQDHFQADQAEKGSRRDAIDGEDFAEGHAEEAEAQHLYLRGRYYCDKYTVEGLQKGADYFRRAIKTGADCALPHSGLAECYYRLANIHLPPDEAIPKARAAVIHALKRDHTLGEAHSLLGLIHTFYDHEWPAAENEFKSAIELDRGSGFEYQRYGWALGLLGRFEEAIPQLERAQALKPRSPLKRVGLGIVFYLARRYEEAIAQAKIGLSLETDFFAARVLLGSAYLQQGRPSEAVAELQKASLLANVSWTLGHLGYAYGVTGKRRLALKILRELEKKAERSYVSPYAFALIHLGLDNRPQALQMIQRTCEDRNEMLGFLKLTPEFDSLRSDQIFARLLHRNRFFTMAG
ncbi:MAG: hypothetical protein QOH71_865 [Blastocatellia bacterium]|jgi:DNA-binding winged helix-turn-helix (wHTH) protein/Flp pilus assembly protein TadD|nr:hypothetical protein [Blastocatellia bacterium]